MKKKKHVWLLAYFLILSIFAECIWSLQEEMLLVSRYSWVEENLNEEDAYRDNAVSESVIEYAAQNNIEGENMAQLITNCFFYEQSHRETVESPEDVKKVDEDKCVNYIQKHYKTAYETLLCSNLAVWSDVKYFPVPLSGGNKDLTVNYENSWKFERTFGGKRYHEGCDIMASENKRGVYPILSMCDGVVEKKGWLPKGGYRIGIRGNSGAYFYYAHLESYADVEEGDYVKAGQLLGFMGDSGYGEEGTTGQFAVHLHVGIYIRTEHNEELSVNPYPVLKYLENQKLTMDFGVE